MNDLVFKDPNEKTPCPECNDTGKVMLFTGISDCKTCKPKQEHYIVYDFVVDSDSKKVTAQQVKDLLSGDAFCISTCGGFTVTPRWSGRVTLAPSNAEREFYRRLFGGE